MRYRQYQQKVLKAVDAINALWRFRLLVLAALVLLIAFVITMASVAGIVSDAAACPSEIAYGEELPYRAKAVFQKVRYQYRRKGEETWSDEAPVTVGNYFVRGVSVGAKKTGEEHAFAIVPRKVEVAIEREWIYGDSPVPIAALCYDDEIRSIDYSYEFSNDGAYITPIPSSMRIFGGTGEDVTRCYSFSAQPCAVSAAPRPVTLTVRDAEKVYDGSPLVSEEYDITEGALAFGDRIEARAESEQINAGESENRLSFSVYDRKGQDVSDYYDLTCIAGKLTVRQRPLRYTTSAARKTFDGTPLYSDGFSVAEDTPLVAGHTASAVSHTEVVDVTVGGAAQNELLLSVTDEEGKDVTANYLLIAESLGELVVDPWEIVIETGTDEWIYDGEAHVSDYFLVDSGTENAPRARYRLAEGHVVVLPEELPSITSVGTAENKYSVSIMDETLADKTFDYSITYVYGLLTVLQRRVILRSSDREEIYDATEKGCLPKDVEDVSSEEQEGILPFHTLFITAYGGITNAGSRENAFFATIISGEEDVTENYEIVPEFGTLTVLPRPVTVRTPTESFVYDGTSHSAAEEYAIVSEYGLVEGHRFEVSSCPEVCNVRETPARNNVVYAVFSEEGEVTENYDLRYEYGELTILPRPVTVTTESCQWTYDGESHSFPYSDDPPLVLDHKLVLDSFTEVTNVRRGEQGEVLSWDNEQTFLVYDGAHNDMTDNYDIDCVCGELTILPRSVTVKTESANWTYDGLCHAPEELSLDGGTLVAGHELRARSVTQHTLAGNWYNEVEAAVVRGDEDLTDQYDISYRYGWLTIARRLITVSTVSKEFVYDGLVHTGEGEFSVEEITGLASGDRGELYDETVITTVGSATNAASLAVYNGEDLDVTSSYRMKYNYGILRVVPRRVTVLTGSGDFEYDGKAHRCEDGYSVVSEQGLVAGHTLLATSSTEITDVGKKQNVVRYSVLDPLERDMTENYELTYQWGTLRVYFGIVIGLYEVSKVYDGTPLSYQPNDYYVKKIPDNMQFSISLSGSITDVGTLDMSYIEGLRYTVRYRSGGTVPADLYAVRFEGTPLTVRARIIEVTSATAKKKYDGTPLTAPDWWVSFGQVASNQRVNVSVTGVQRTYGSSENVIDSVTVTDLYGREVTGNYDIRLRPGTLTVE